MDRRGSGIQTSAKKIASFGQGEKDGLRRWGGSCDGCELRAACSPPSVSGLVICVARVRRGFPNARTGAKGIQPEMKFFTVST